MEERFGCPEHRKHGAPLPFHSTLVLLPQLAVLHDTGKCITHPLILLMYILKLEACW